MSIIDHEAVLAGLSGPSVEDTFGVTESLFEELQELSRALRGMAEGTADPDLAARQRAVADAFYYDCESYGGHLHRYRVTFPGGHQVEVRPLAENPEEARAEAMAKAKAKVAKQAARRSSPLGWLLFAKSTSSVVPLPVGVEPVSAIRIG